MDFLQKLVTHSSLQVFHITYAFAYNSWGLSGATRNIRTSSKFARPAWPQVSVSVASRTGESYSRQATCFARASNPRRAYAYKRVAAAGGTRRAPQVSLRARHVIAPVLSCRPLVCLSARYAATPSCATRRPLRHNLPASSTLQYTTRKFLLYTARVQDILRGAMEMAMRGAETRCVSAFEWVVECRGGNGEEGSEAEDSEVLCSAPINRWRPSTFALSLRERPPGSNMLYRTSAWKCCSAAVRYDAFRSELCDTFLESFWKWKLKRSAKREKSGCC